MQNKPVQVLFEKIADQYPDRIAVESDRSSISYVNLNRLANTIAHSLRDRSPHKNAIVATILPPGIDLVAAILGIFKAGCIYMPVDISFSRSQLQRMLTDNKILAIIVDETTEDQALSLIAELSLKTECKLSIKGSNRVEVLWPDGSCIKTMAQYGLNGPLVQIEERQPNYIFYSSGSTGTPKAILGASISLSHFIQWEIGEYQLDTSVRVSQLTQFTFDASLRDIFVPLCAGGTLCIPSLLIRTDIGKLLSWIDEKRITLIHCVPSVFRLFIRELDNDSGLRAFSHLKFVLTAGEPLYARDLQKWSLLIGDKIEVTNLYGTTETTLAKTFHRIKDIPTNPGEVIHVGKPINDTAILILNGNRLCQIGEIGDVYIRTRFITNGYVNNIELQKKMFVQNPLVTDYKDIVYRTGDLGRYLKSRDIEIIGRADNLVKVNGIQIDLDLIRKTLSEVKGIDQVVVMTKLNPENNQIPVCYYTGTWMDAATIIAHLKDTAYVHMIPIYFVYLKEFPLNSNGKIDKKSLQNFREAAQEETVPLNKTESAILSFWKEIFGTCGIGLETSFFEIGGSSIKAFQIISRVKREMRIEVTIKDVFEYDTIRRFSEKIGTRKHQQAEELVSAFPKASIKSHYPVSNAQRRIWIQQKVENRAGLFNMYRSYRVKEPVDSATLMHCIERIIDNHEILRTCFTFIQNEIRQVINEKIDVSLVFETLEYSHPDDSAVREYKMKFSTLPLSLEIGPLFKVVLIKYDSGDYDFDYVFHHIIVDEWSLEIFHQELMDLYLNAGQPDSEIAFVSIQYKEYCEWQNNFLKTEECERQKQYWLGQFSENFSPYKVQFDFQTKISKNEERKSILELSPGLTQMFNDKILKSNCTPFIVILSSIYILLYRWSGKKEISIGSPVSNRSHPDLERAIGIYLNMLPLNISLESTDTFGSVVSKVKSLCLSGFSMADYPYDLMLADLRRSGSSANLFEIGFTWHEDQINIAIDLEHESNGNESFTRPSRNPMWIHSFYNSALKERVVVVLSFNSSLYKKETIDLLLDKLNAILANGLKDENQPIIYIPLPGTEMSTSQPIQIELNL